MNSAFNWCWAIVCYILVGEYKIVELYRIVAVVVVIIVVSDASKFIVTHCSLSLKNVYKMPNAMNEQEKTYFIRCVLGIEPQTSWYQYTHTRIRKISIYCGNFLALGNWNVKCRQWIWFCLTCAKERNRKFR